MDIAARITAALQKALTGLGIEGVTPALEHPTELAHGDFATNVALAAAKAAKKNPKALAEEVVAAVGTIDGVEKVEVAGLGFINFYLTRAFVASTVVDIAAIGSEWGKGGLLAGKRVMYEYTDPNPFKVFHIGHLMSNTLGESLARLAEYSGAVVVRANYQGDIGPHVAKCVWGVMQKQFDPNDIAALGEAYVYGSSAYESDPTAKQEIDDINKRLYAKDPELQPIYDAGRKASLEHFEELYALLGTKFNHYFFESEVGPVGIEVVKEGLTQGVFEESDGAVVYKGEKVGLHTRVFITKAQTPTYETKELGLDKTKFEKEKLDRSVIVTANEQDGFFKVVLAAMAEVLPDVAAKTVHISHGMMVLTTGKMSSRKGDVVTGESLINDMREQALEKMASRDLGDQKESIADAVAVAAIKFEVLKQGSGKNIVFDPVQSLSFEGDSGPYLQYAHTRALSILAKARAERIQPSGAMAPESMTDLERMLYRFPEVVQRAMESYEPHYVTTYLTQIAGLYNAWYATTTIVDPTDPHSPYRIALTEAFAHTMRNGLWLLGIKAPERM
ncbi:MAG: arginine--tRNA ligase [Candidatus Pacebacteria bacterium]|nr:arginine--tRNA ligase [Candidatus Paceibacterota bacterium]